MDKTKIKQILTDAKMSLTEIQFNHILRFIRKKQFTALRLYITDELEILEIKNILGNGNIENLHERKALNNIEDVVLDYCINSV